MVQYQRYYQQLKKGEVVPHGNGSLFRTNSGSNRYYKRARPKLLSLFLLTLLSFSVIWSSRLLSFLLPYSSEPKEPPCSYVPNGTICCDRTSNRTDICFMKGDVRAHPASNSIFLYYTTKPNPITTSPDADVPVLPQPNPARSAVVERIKPYTRKWEPTTMANVDQLKLIQNPTLQSSLTTTTTTTTTCDVRHNVPAIIFSTGGYTGNLYHEFNDGIIPLFITSHHLKRRVVFAIVDYHSWWYMKYQDILSHLSDYPPLDLGSQNKTHCFPEAIVGLRIHNELTVDPSLMPDNSTTISDFRRLLDRAYRPRIEGLIQEEQQQLLASSPSSTTTSSSSPEPTNRIPKLVILARNGSRAIANQDSLVSLADRIGFSVEVLTPRKDSELAKIYRTLNETDVLVGVHGAALTHLLFMRPGTVFVQIVPVGVEWAAGKYFAEPAVKFGLKYVHYSVLPTESSLFDRYDEDDPVFTDPRSVEVRGWEFVKKIYLDDQVVRLSLRRFKKVLEDAFEYVSTRRGQLLQFNRGVR